MRAPLFAALTAAALVLSAPALATDVAVSDRDFLAEHDLAERILLSLKGGERNIIDELIDPREMDRLLEVSEQSYKAGNVKAAFEDLRKVQLALQIRFD